MHAVRQIILFQCVNIQEKLSDWFFLLLLVRFVLFRVLFTFVCCEHKQWKCSNQIQRKFTHSWAFRCIMCIHPSAWTRTYSHYNQSNWNHKNTLNIISTLEVWTLNTGNISLMVYFLILSLHVERQAIETLFDRLRFIEFTTNRFICWIILSVWAHKMWCGRKIHLKFLPNIWNVWQWVERKTNKFTQGNSTTSRKKIDFLRHLCRK